MRTSLPASKRVTNEGPSTTRSVTTIQRYWDQVRAYFLLPATFGKSCNFPTWYGTLPCRAETTIICMHLIINVILCAVNYTAFDRNLFWKDHGAQVWRFFADRTGYLSYANTAVFFAFGIRNNILIWMTGWSFGTFNRFHRWTARVATVEAILHSIGYTAFYFVDSESGYAAYSAEFKERFWYGQLLPWCAFTDNLQVDRSSCNCCHEFDACLFHSLASCQVLRPLPDTAYLYGFNCSCLFILLYGNLQRRVRWFLVALCCILGVRSSLSCYARLSLLRRRCQGQGHGGLFSR